MPRHPEHVRDEESREGGTQEQTDADEHRSCGGHEQGARANADERTGECKLDGQRRARDGARQPRFQRGIGQRVRLGDRFDAGLGTSATSSVPLDE